MGNEDGLIYAENTGTATAPVFMQRTGSANPFDRLSTLLDGVVDGVFDAKPALADLDKDGTLRPCPSIDELFPHV